MSLESSDPSVSLPPPPSNSVAPYASLDFWVHYVQIALITHLISDTDITNIIITLGGPIQGTHRSRSLVAWGYPEVAFNVAPPH